jgi:YesN/AraC family two-component response regulator
VIQARNGAEALKAFDGGVDLLLTDLQMPYVRGDSLIAQLRERRHTLKVLAFSGYPPGLDADVPFLSKPFSREALLSAVAAVLPK